MIKIIISFYFKWDEYDSCLIWSQWANCSGSSGRLEVCNFCSDLGFHKVIFKGDVMTIMNALRHGDPCWSSFGQLIEDTQTQLHSFQSYVVRHIRRYANKAAHQMTKLVLSQLLDQVWLEECLFFIQSIVLAEQEVSFWYMIIWYHFIQKKKLN